jgi:NAD(P)-dependent dehydrogenase (short-subunit alcohol dehydrogenase family)
MEWARYGIRVNAIASGIVDSDMWDLIDLELGKLEHRVVGATRTKYVDDLVLLGRLSIPSDIGKFKVSFLASSDSEYITGQTMVCDGGISFA